MITSNFLVLFVFLFDQGLVQGGLFGYNALLCGLALATFGNGELHSGWDLNIAVAAVLTSVYSAVLFVTHGKVMAP